MKKIMGVFTYDCFPGMSVLDITGWDENGDCILQGGVGMKASALIAVFPKKQGEAILRSLNDMRQQERRQMKELRKQLLEDFFEEHPTLERNK